MKDIRYVGCLSRDDPLYRCICIEVLPRVGLSGEKNFKVYREAKSTLDDFVYNL